MPTLDAERPGRSSALILALRDALRDHTALVDQLLDGEPDRIYHGRIPAETDYPVDVSLSLTTPTSSRLGQGMIEQTYLVTVTLATNGDYFNAAGPYGLTDLLDCVAEVCDNPGIPYVSPLGAAGGNGITTEDTGERSLVARWRFSIVAGG